MNDALKFAFKVHNLMVGGKIADAQDEIIKAINFRSYVIDRKGTTDMYRIFFLDYTFVDASHDKINKMITIEDVGRTDPKGLDVAYALDRHNHLN